MATIFNGTSTPAKKIMYVCIYLCMSSAVVRMEDVGAVNTYVHPCIHTNIPAMTATVLPHQYSTALLEISPRKNLIIRNMRATMIFLFKKKTIGMHMDVHDGMYCLREAAQVLL